jgi:hypothetical protein
MDAILTTQAAFFGPASAQSSASRQAQELRTRLRRGEVPTHDVIRFLAANEPAYPDVAREARADVQRAARARRRDAVPVADEGGGA